MALSACDVCVFAGNTSLGQKKIFSMCVCVCVCVCQKNVLHLEKGWKKVSVIWIDAALVLHWNQHTQVETQSTCFISKHVHNGAGRLRIFGEEPKARTIQISFCSCNALAIFSLPSGRTSTHDAPLVGSSFAWACFKRRDLAFRSLIT